MGPGDVVAQRFELGAVAGAGAFGRVFRAHDRETGRTVALKVLEEARPEVVDRFRREVTLLASITHPHVVGHVASGVDGSRYAYLAMDWLEGEDLARRLARGPLDAAELVGLARGALAGLSAAHALGIVHRDVKPSNVWLVDGRPDQPRLLDFGLARLAAASSLTRVGTFLGTPEYMSPEQVKGVASLDQRADLFSLGCVLSECALGVTPFAAPTALAVATRVLLDEPPRVDVERPDLPPAFADLVERLLAKAPEQRPSLAEALALLDAASATLPPPSRAAPPARRSAAPAPLRSEPPPPRRAMASASGALPASSAVSSASSSLLGRAPPFVGRDAELAALEGAFDACVREKAARLVVVEGDAGTGKTRLVRELLAALARRASPLVIAARGEVAERSEPLRALARATADALGLVGPSGDVDALRADLQVALAPRLPAAHAPRVTAFFGELLGAPFPDGAHPLLAAARAEGARTGDQIARAWADWVDAEAQERPVVVVLDDAAEVDAPSLDVVLGAVRQLRRRRLLVIALTRGDARDRLPEPLRAPAATIPVGPLPPEAGAAIARAALGSQVSTGIVERVVELSAGIPLHLEELVRAAASGGDVGAPATVEVMVAARVGALDAVERPVIEAASVLGSEVDEAAIAALLEGWLTPEGIGPAVDRLIALELLHEVPSGGAGEGRRLAFRHAVVRDVAGAGIDPARRAALHGRAARWLARTARWSPSIVAEHLVRSGEIDVARAFFRRAADVAIESNDFAGAIAAVERALEAGAATEERGPLRLLQAEASRHLADNESMLARALDGCAALPPWSRPWFRAASLVVLGAIRLGRAELLDQITPALLAAARRGDLPAASARAAHYLFFAGRSAVAEELLAATGDASDAEPDRDAWVARACATRALLAGDMATYLEHLEHAIAAFEQAGDVREQAAERANAGFAQMELGLWAAAEATLRAALEAAERTGLRHVEAVARVNLGEALFRGGYPTEGLALLDAAIGALRRQRNLRMEGNACVYRARLHLASGELEAAHRDATCAVERLGHVPPLLPLALAVLATVHAAAGRLEEASTSAADALARLEGGGRADEGEAFVRRVAAEVAMAGGDVARAVAIVSDARDRLLTRAGRIARDDWRASFLQLPDHRRTLELHAWWTSGGDAPATIR